MTKTLLLAIAAAFTAAANEIDNEPTPGGDTTAPTNTTGEPPKRRGRPPGSITALPEPPKAPAESAEDKTAIRKAAFEPLIKAGRGKEVKGVITSYGVESSADIPDDKHDAFLRDIEALTM